MKNVVAIGLIALMMTGIEKRKRNLKRMFNVKKLDDRQLMISAKEKGFL
jgi:hypothetical protein